MHKICHISTVHPVFDVRIFEKQLRTLKDNGYTAHLIIQYKKDAIVHGIKIHALPKPKNRIHRIIWLPIVAFKKALNTGADLFHFHDPEFIPMGYLLKMMGKKVIYDVHEDTPKQMLGKPYASRTVLKVFSAIVAMLENYAAKRFDAVVAATPFINKRFSTLGCNAIDVNNFPILGNGIGPAINWTDKENAVCYIGAISAIRGIAEMVTAVELAGLRLLLGGRFNSVALRNQVLEMKGWEYVNELGQIPWDEIGKVHARSIAGLVLYHPQPNHADAQPNKMFEYMGAGIPVIASNFALWKEIVEGNNCGICVDPLDPCAIACAINWICEHPNIAIKMGENGKKAVNEKYCWQTEGKKLLKLYQGVLFDTSISSI